MGSEIMRLSRISEAPGRCRVLILVFYLNTNYIAPVFKIQSMYLLSYLVIKFFYIREIQRIIGSDIEWFGQQPIWKPSVPNLSMSERTYPYNNF